MKKILCYFHAVLSGKGRGRDNGKQRICDNHSNERQSRDGDVVVKAEHEMIQPRLN